MSTIPPDMVRTERLTFGYPGRALGKGISVRLRRGELVGLVGANGAGKSTLLRTLTGLHPPLGGRILIGGNGKPESEIAGLDSNSLARRISIVLTERVDSEDLTGRDLVSLGRYPYTGWDGRLNEDDERCVDWALEAVGAVRLAACSLRRMSDGERQKVMIARALAQETEVIILDEPTAFLDYPHRLEIMQTLKQLAHRRCKAVLFSTHDLDLALRNVDTLWALGDGSLETGAPEDLILNGSLEKTFRHAGEPPSGLVFDRRSGAFQYEMPDGPGIYLSGHGISAAWTMRALQRDGYRIARRGRGGDAAVLEIEVRNGDGERIWLLSERGESEKNARTEAGVIEFRSIADLMAYMKRRFTTGS